MCAFDVSVMCQPQALLELESNADIKPTLREVIFSQALRRLMLPARRPSLSLYLNRRHSRKYRWEKAIGCDGSS